MRMNQGRSYKKIIIGASIAVVVIAGLVFYMVGGIEKVRAAFQPKSQDHSISVTGKLLCLPRRDGGDTSALSCALGVQAQSGKYYGISGSKNTELSEITGSDKNVKLSGELQTSSDTTYKMDGIIAVSSYDVAN